MKAPGPAGRVAEDGGFATLVFERTLPYPPERVWRALTDPTELSQWYMTRAVIDGRKGGSIDFISGPSRLHVTGTITEWEPPHLFEHVWHVEPIEALPSGEDAVIRWELTQAGGGTLLRLEHRKLHSQTALGFAPGAHAFLDRLDALLSGSGMPNWAERYREVAGSYPPSWVSGR